MPNTPNASLPYPSLASVPNVPSDIQSLATSLDTKVPGFFASAGSRNSAVGSPVDGVPCYRTDIHAPENYHGGVGGWVHGCVLIAESVVSSPLSSLTVNLPQDFRDLRITSKLRDTAAGTYFNWSLRINGDAGNNYSDNGIFNNNFAASNSSIASATGTSSNHGFLAGSSSGGSNVWGQGVMDIPFYSTNGPEKLGIYTCGINFGGGTANWTSGMWMWAGSANITSLTIIPSGGTSLQTGSVFRFYGIG